MGNDIFRHTVVDLSAISEYGCQDEVECCRITYDMGASNVSVVEISGEVVTIDVDYCCGVSYPQRSNNGYQFIYTP